MAIEWRLSTMSVLLQNDQVITQHAVVLGGFPFVWLVVFGHITLLLALPKLGKQLVSLSLSNGSFFF